MGAGSWSNTKGEGIGKGIFKPRMKEQIELKGLMRETALPGKIFLKGSTQASTPKPEPLRALPRPAVFPAPNSAPPLPTQATLTEPRRTLQISLGNDPSEPKAAGGGRSQEEEELWESGGPSPPWHAGAMGPAWSLVLGAGPPPSAFLLT